MLYEKGFFSWSNLFLDRRTALVTKGTYNTVLSTHSKGGYIEISDPLSVDDGHVILASLVVARHVDVSPKRAERLPRLGHERSDYSSKMPPSLRCPSRLTCHSSPNTRREVGEHVNWRGRRRHPRKGRNPRRTSWPIPCISSVWM